MATLWFKQQYVGPILRGEKVDTVRATPPRVKPGDLVAASVGPRPPFAWLRIVAVEPVTLDDLPVERREAVRALYPTATTFYRVSWDRVVPGAPPGRTPSSSSGGRPTSG